LIQLAELPFEKMIGTPAGILVLRTLKAEQLERLLAKKAAKRVCGLVKFELEKLLNLPLSS
jgi:hypothetical protein